MSHNGLNSSGTIQFGNFIESNDKDVHYLVNVDDTNVYPILIKAADKKGIVEISREISEKIKKIKKKNSEEYKYQMNTFNKIPFFLVKPLIMLVSFVSYQLNSDFKLMKIKKQQFGSLGGTNIMKMGRTFWAPLNRLVQSSCLFTINTPTMKPIVKNGEIVIKKMLEICITFDHRYADGAQASKLIDNSKEVTNNPGKYL